MQIYRQHRDISAKWMIRKQSDGSKLCMD